jgi:hypothetical protein
MSNPVASINKLNGHTHEFEHLVNTLFPGDG